MPGKCPRCGNERYYGLKQVWKGPNIGYRRVVDKDRIICPYCKWKGDEGPGKLLKDIIKGG